MTIKEKIMQKFAGIFFIVMSILAIWLEKDATIAVIFVPLGLYLIFTKKQIMY